MNPVDAYVQVWSEPNSERQAALLKSCWSENSAIIGPGYCYRGLQEVLDEVDRFHRDESAVRAVQTSAVDRHGSWARFTIAVIDGEGKTMNEGWDIVEFDGDDKIARVITFWGTLSPVP